MVRLDAQKPVVNWRNFSTRSLTREKVVRLAHISELWRLVDATPVIGLAVQFILAYQDTIERCNSKKQILEVYDKAKRETSALESKLDIISERVMAPGFDYIKVVNKYNEAVQKVTSTTVIRSCSDGETEDMRLFGYHNPKCFIYLYKAVKEVCNQVSYMTEEARITVLANLESFILTIAHVYDDMECEELTDMLEQQAYEGMVMKPMPLDKEIANLLSQLRSDLEDKSFKYKYIQPLKRYIKHVSSSMHFSYDHLHVSSASSGTYIKRNGKRSTVPSFLSSQLETDPFVGNDVIKRFDELVDFPSGLYPDAVEVDQLLKENNWELDSHPVTTMYIKQHKLKRRCIHMAINPIQDRLAVFRHAMKEAALRYLTSDCEGDQDVGRMRAKMLSKRAKDEGLHVHCYDIHDATGTNSIAFQEECIDIITGSRELAKAFTQLTQVERWNKFSNGKCFSYKPNRGQPQGTEPSFDGLTIMHYILFLMVMIKLDLRHLDPKDFFEITGDDSVQWINALLVAGWWDTESDDLLGSTYRYLAEKIGWEVHPTKGYHFNPNYQETCTVEFCKQAYLNGILKSAMPLELFGQLDTIAGVTSLILWLHRPSARGRISYQEFITKLLRCGYQLTDVQQLYVLLSASAGEELSNNAFRNIELTLPEKLALKEYDRWFLAYSTLNSMSRLLTRSLIRNKDTSDKASLKDYRLFKDDKEMDDSLLMSCRSPERKLSTIYDQNADKIAILEDIAGLDRERSLRLMASLGIEEGRGALDNFIKYLEFVEYLPNWFEEMNLETLKSASKYLDKLQPYSMSRQVRRQTQDLLDLDEEAFVYDLIHKQIDIPRLFAES